MLAVEYHSNEDIRVLELPMPEIGPGEVLVQLQACGICASDVMEWYMKPRAPIYPGHEPVGIVAAAGEGAEQFSPGQRTWKPPSEGSYRLFNSVSGDQSRRHSANGSTRPWYG